jgi:malate permease and related proteins
VIAGAATIAAATAVGVWAERRWGEPAQLAARRLLIGALYTLSPFVTFFNVARLHVDANVAGGLGLGIVMLVLVGGAAWFVGTRLLHLRRPEQGSLIASVMHANTGYVGLPFVVVLLGSSQLGVGAKAELLVEDVDRKSVV